MNYEEYVEKLAGEILDEATGSEEEENEEMEVQASEEDLDNYVMEKTAAKMQAIRGAARNLGGKATGAAKGVASKAKDVGGSYVGRLKGQGSHNVQAQRFMGGDQASLNRLARRQQATAIGGTAAGVGAAGGAAGVAANRKRKDGQGEKVASYYEEAQMIKQAAEEAYLEAQAMEDASIEVLAELGYEFE